MDVGMGACRGHGLFFRLVFGRLKVGLGICNMANQSTSAMASAGCLWEMISLWGQGRASGASLWVGVAGLMGGGAG